MGGDTVLIENLSVAYRRSDRVTEALSEVSCHLAEGAVLGITGPSGSGKSTLLHVLAGIITEYRGRVLLHGTPPDPKRHSIGFVPQNYGLLPWKKIEENIRLPFALGRAKSFSSEQFKMVVGELEIADLLRRYPHELSGGQRQRVALARAFVHSPEVLLLDEPFSALDFLTAERCRLLFGHLRERTGVTTVMVTHNIEEAVAMSHKVLVIGGTPGRVISCHDTPSVDVIKQQLIGLLP